MDSLLRLLGTAAAEGGGLQEYTNLALKNVIKFPTVSNSSREICTKIAQQMWSALKLEPHCRRAMLRREADVTREPLKSRVFDSTLTTIVLATILAWLKFLADLKAYVLVN